MRLSSVWIDPYAGGVNRLLRGLIALALAAGAAAGCSTDQPPQTFPSIELRPDQRTLGTLINRVPATKIAHALASATSRAENITYTTIGPDGAPAAATGGLYLPAGDPPPGGWPLVAFGHGTTGVQQKCAPTLAADMYQNLPIVLAALTELRAAVVMPDYFGLGSAGHHPYLDSQSHGYDVLGAVRAARATGATLSNRLFLLGISQGGRATEAAAELAPTATPELKFAANAMAVPALSLQFRTLIAQGTLTGPQYSIFPQMVFGAQASSPGLAMSDVLHGTLLKAAPAFIKDCSGSSLSPWIDPSGPPIGPADVRPDGTPAGVKGSDTFLEYLRRTELPSRPNGSVPTLVINGTDDELILPAWTESAVAKMCSAGVPVEHRVRGGRHYSPSDLGDLISWLRDRIANKPLRATCTNGAPRRG